MSSKGDRYPSLFHVESMCRSLAWDGRVVVVDGGWDEMKGEGVGLETRVGFLEVGRTGRYFATPTRKSGNTLWSGFEDAVLEEEGGWPRRKRSPDGDINGAMGEVECRKTFIRVGVLRNVGQCWAIKLAQKRVR